MPEIVTLALRIGITYKEAWRVLYNCFGERMQNDELELMNSILQSVKLDFEERKDENAIPKSDD